MVETNLAAKRIAFLGFGLIGGSIALSLRARGWMGQATAWTPSGHGPEAAAATGLVERADVPEVALREADLVVLAAPPLAVLELIDGLAGPWRSALAPDAVITDVASTKRAIVGAANGHQLPFVGGHPMAGRDRSGVEAATPDLFLDRTWVLVPGSGARAAAIARVRWLVTAVGANTIEMTAEAHDRAVAGISHLPLITAAALVEAVAGERWDEPDDPDRRLAASGWADMTRLARGDVEMGTGILATNADETAAGLRALRAVLDRWLDALEGDAPDVDDIRRRLQAARTRLQQGDG